MLDAIFKPFVEQSPVCVMAVAAARRLLGRERPDGLLARARVGQYVHRPMSADLSDLMAAVVSGTRKSVHHAYQSSGDRRLGRRGVRQAGRASGRPSAGRRCGRRRPRRRRRR